MIVSGTAGSHFEGVASETFAEQHAQASDLIAAASIAISSMELNEREWFAAKLTAAAHHSFYALTCYEKGEYRMAFRALDWANDKLAWVGGR